VFSPNYKTFIYNLSTYLQCNVKFLVTLWRTPTFLWVHTYSYAAV